MPLPEDKGLRGDGRPKVRRYRNQHLELGRRLAAFRARYGVTQEEIARVDDAGDRSAVSQWESGVAVPNGMCRERLLDLLAGRLWDDLRETAIAGGGDGLPMPWDRAARWYRRASRERRSRETVGVAVATVLAELWVENSLEVLRQRYCECDGDWVRGVADRCGLGDDYQAELRRVEDAAYGLRWLGLAHESQLDPLRSLVAHPLGLLT